MIANIVAWPVAWLLLDNWLSNFAYRISLNPMPFITVTVVMGVLIAAVITLQIIRKAMESPVTYLRNE